MGSVSIGGDRPAAASAYAPSQYPTANCALTTGIGASAVGGGFSIGSSHVEENCARIEKAKAVASLGDHAAAFEVLCGDPDIRAARRRAGNLCWADRQGSQPPESSKCSILTDPLVRRREGCNE